ncbi:MAG: 2-dehydro-3-deoxygalactonokinase [Maritimibacter harenae]
MARATTDWICVDWSEDRLRVWVMGPDGAVSAREEADMTGLSAFETGLGPVIAPYLQDDEETDILVAGDPAAPGGWGAAAPRAVPCAPPGQGDTTPGVTHDGRMRVALVPGLQQVAPTGLMLADAVRVRGFLARNPGYDGVLCLAGRRTRWVHVSAGEVVSFQSFSTGDLVRSTCATLGIEGAPGEGLEAAVDDAMSRPEAAAARIGAAEAGLRLGTLSQEAALAEIWGLFLGLEMAAARPYWLGQPVALVGEGDRRAAYARAMTAQAVMFEEADEEETILAGFAAIRG